VGHVRGFWLILLAGLLLACSTSAAGADPNEPYWASEWGPRLTRASDLWNLTTGSPSIVIAVVDTGLSQPLFKATDQSTPVPDLTQVLPGWNLVGNNGDTTDTFGHGTWVSSIIGAEGNNGIGIAGYCWHCSIMPVRVAAGHEGALAGNIAAGIRWSVDHGARIVNVSLASNQPDEDELGAVEYAQEHGVLVVTSAGNGGNTAPLYPAWYGTAWTNVLSVAGTDENDLLESWSTRGAWVDIAAPGCEEVLDPTLGPEWGCGSSFGPPAVSGIAGLLLSIDPGLTVNQLVEALQGTAHPVSGIGGGEVDAWAAAHALGLAPENPPVPAPAAVTPAPPPPPTVSPQVLVTTGTVRRSANVILPLDPGELQLQLLGPAATACAMSVRIAGEIYTDIPGERNLRTLGATITKRGKYPVSIRCASANRKDYELTATAIFSP
jgi:thermitase